MIQPIPIKRGSRSPFVKMNGPFARINPVELSVRVIDGMLSKNDVPQGLIQHVVWGMVVADPNIYSIAREAVIASRLDNRVEAYSVSRACATSLQAATNAALYYHAFPDENSVAIAGGVESFSTVRPVLTEPAARYFKSLAAKGSLPQKLARLLKVPFGEILPVPPSAKEYSTGLTMGEHCELMVKEFKVARERQDALALKSHQNAVAAQAAVQSQIIPVEGISKDTLIRPDTSAGALAKLRPAFDAEKGTITAGNASPFTDGAAAVYVLSPKAAETVRPDAHIIDFEYVGVELRKGLLMGPGKALLRVLSRQKLKWRDMDYIEIHEAFAGEVLCNVDAVNSPDYRRKEYGIDYDAGVLDENRLNPWGSSIAYGHPFGATGARMLSQAAEYLQRNGKNYALIGICTAGGLAGACLLRRAER